MSTEKYSLYYFNFPGRGESVRLVFRMAGVEFNDIHIDFPKLAEMKKAKELPFNCAPMLQLGDFKLNGTAAIVQYLSQEFKLWPENPKESAIALSILLFLDDVRAAAFKVMFGKTEEKEANVNAFLESFAKFEDSFLRIVGDKKFIFGDVCNIVDVIVWEFLHNLAKQFVGEFKGMKKYYEYVSTVDIVQPYLKK